jgi:hypothetical protein
MFVFSIFTTLSPPHFSTIKTTTMKQVPHLCLSVTNGGLGMAYLFDLHHSHDPTTTKEMESIHHYSTAATKKEVAVVAAAPFLFFDGLGLYWELTKWGFCQTVQEWWVLECVIFAISCLKGAEQTGLIAASSVVGNLQAVFIMAWIGLLVAASVLVGKHVGEDVGEDGIVGDDVGEGSGAAAIEEEAGGSSNGGGFSSDGRSSRSSSCSSSSSSSTGGGSSGASRSNSTGGVSNGHTGNSTGGSGGVQSAKRAAAAVVVVAALCGVLVGLLLALTKHQLASLYSKDAVVVEASETLLQVLCLVVLCDAVNNALGGVLCGLGLQKEAAKSQLTGYCEFELSCSRCIF